MSPERFVKGESERTLGSSPETWVTEGTGYLVDQSLLPVATMVH